MSNQHDEDMSINFRFTVERDEKRENDLIPFVCMQINCTAVPVFKAFKL